MPGSGGQYRRWTPPRGRNANRPVEVGTSSARGQTDLAGEAGFGGVPARPVDRNGHTRKGYKAIAVSPPITKRYQLSRLILGNAKSRAPIIMGKRKLPSVETLR